MKKHVVKIGLEMTFVEMDGTPEQSALIAMDLIDEAFSIWDNGFSGFYDLQMDVQECYEIEQESGQ